ncbi:hypothetical protein CSPAE12_11161 [Colletotrichum incanum]|nr:hypothetical protein CSPAE12_11161 [Colletotrichum incanum]
MTSIPNTPAEVLAWLQRSHDVHDSLQVTDFHKVYSQNAQVKFANYPITVGLDAIKEAFVPTFDQLTYMKHTTRHADKVGDRIWLAVDITYRVKDDLEHEDINVPASGLVTLVTEGGDAGKIKRFEVFIDQTPVRQRIEAVNNKRLVLSQ